MKGTEETEVTINEVQGIFNRDFVNEKHLSDYIELNVDLFCFEDLGIEYKTHKRECRTDMNSRLGNRGRKVDFFIKSKCGQNIIVECKNPRSATSDLTSAIGQLLGYKAEYNLNNIIIHRMVLCVTDVTEVFLKAISDNQLPIEVICLDKSKRLKAKYN